MIMIIEQTILNNLNEISYGWIDKENNIHDLVNEDFSKLYKLQSPEEVLTNKVGVCWDQVELERSIFTKENYKIKTYFICHYDNASCPTHTFLVYEKNNKFYWFEHSWEIFRGIHEYNSIYELLSDVKEKFIKYELNNNYNKYNLLLREYSKPKYGISVIEFYKHCEENEIINI